MKVEIAKYSGYCFGVKRALRITETVLEKYKNKKINVYSIGQIIHNEGVIDDLKKKGLIIVKNESQIEPGSVFIVRSHGMSPEFIKRIKSKGVKIVDTACPFVKGAQSKAKMLSKRGYHLVIIGNKNHPEVMSVMEHANMENLTVIESPDEIKTLKNYEKIGVIMQTTQIKENAKSIISGLLDKAKELLVENTICNITENKQNITKELAKKVDIMLIIGGKNSANTTHLTEIARNHNPRTYHVTNYTEIDKKWFTGARLAGISGGASTPEKDVKEAKSFIENLSG